MQAATTIRCSAKHLQQAACVRARHVPIHAPVLPVRCLTAKATDDKEKDLTWSQIGKSAADLLGAVVHKITAPLAPKASDSKPVPESPKVNLPDLSFPSGGALPTLFGKAMGSLVGMAVQAIGSQVAKSAKDSAAVYEQAAARIRSSAALRARLGDITVSQPLSQSVSSVNINGKLTERITLLLPLYGSNNTAGPSRGAMAQVYATRNGSKADMDLEIDVQLPTGETLRVQDGGSSATGSVIDVEYQVKDQVKK